jgi:hypothetical protein
LLIILEFKPEIRTHLFLAASAAVIGGLLAVFVFVLGFLASFVSSDSLGRLRLAVGDIFVAGDLPGEILGENFFGAAEFAGLVFAGGVFDEAVFDGPGFAGLIVGRAVFGEAGSATAAFSAFAISKTFFAVPSGVEAGLILLTCIDFGKSDSTSR